MERIFSLWQQECTWLYFSPWMEFINLVFSRFSPNTIMVSHFILYPLWENLIQSPSPQHSHPPQWELGSGRQMSEDGPEAGQEFRSGKCCVCSQGSQFHEELWASTCAGHVLLSVQEPWCLPHCQRLDSPIMRDFKGISQICKCLKYHFKEFHKYEVWYYGSTIHFGSIALYKHLWLRFGIKDNLEIRDC